MKAVIYEQAGPPEMLRYVELPLPPVTQADVRIRVQAISVEGGDLRKRSQVQPPSADHVLGYQAAGIVEEVGAGVTLFKPGDRAVAFNWSGAYAEQFVVPQHFAYHIPEDLDLRVAAAMPVTTGTASDALFELGNAVSGETVLIHGATGGVGIAAIQLAAAAGLKVIATASKEEHYPLLLRLGAAEIINHATERVEVRAREVNGNRSVDLVVDCAGGPAASKLLRVLRYRGRISLVGMASGQEASFSFSDIAARSLAVVGVSFGREMHQQRVRQMLAAHFKAAASGALHVPISAEFTLDKAVEAHAYAERRPTLGRVLMTP
jgi:NADPH:quinone reductase